MGRKSSGLVRFARWAGAASLLALAMPAGALSDAQKSWYAARLADNARGQFNDPMLGGLLPRTPDALAESVVQWDRLRRDSYSATFAELSGFLRGHPGWPQELVLRRRAERALQPDTPMADRLAYFTRFPPVTASGSFRYAEALLGAGRRDEAIRFARQAWTSDGLSAAGETELLAKFASALTGADHAARVDRLIWSNQTTAAQRVLGLVPADRRAPLEARLALRSRAVDADGRYQALSDAQRNDPGVVMDRAIWLRDGLQVDAARRLVADAATLPGAPVDPVRWMTFRLDLARAAARDGQNDLAYRIAANHRSFPLGRPLNSWSDSERDKLTDLEWLAGWTALKSIGAPARAVDHFQNYRNAAQSPITQARGDYWAGRAAEAAGDRAKARRFYESAATHPDYFFGQLSLERLGRPVTVARPQPVTVSPQVRQAFENSEMVRVVRMLSELGDRPRETLFLRTMVERADTLAEQRLLADLAPQLGRPDIGVLVGREARNDGEMALLDVAYPRLNLAGDTATAWSMVHAITRQESRFDRTAVSSANAQGLMQLMPATARETAGKAGLAYDFNRLTTDEQYNVTLGSTYFRALLDRWGGNHVLAVASYNAGAGNVNRWIRANGDPRNPGVDVVDWIERIPFTETRIYVWRVLENAVMYDALHPERATMPAQNRLSAYLGKSTPG